MAWPASVITRQISFGKAVVLETGDDLSLRVVTKATRSLISLAEGYRMESLTTTYEAGTPGSDVIMLLPVTNQSGWLDAETREPIVVGPDQHSHLYNSVLTIFKGTAAIGSYDIGPYPLPMGSGVIDGDTMLIPSTTEEGVLIPMPELWQEIIDSANAALSGDGSTAGQVYTSTGPNTPPTFQTPATPPAPGNLRAVFYNATAGTWPARPNTTDPVIYMSTLSPAALRPTGTAAMRTGDAWLRHPQASVAP